MFLACASEGGQALIDRELYLPGSWTEDRDRCRESGVPDGTEFAAKPQLAQAMIGRALEAGVPFAWFTADEVYGQAKWLQGARTRNQAKSVLVPSLATAQLGSVRSNCGRSTIFMATTRSRRRWAVRLSIARRGGWHAWGPVSGDFERSLGAQAGSAVIAPRVDAETRRGRGHVRVTMAMTIASADVAGALAEAWQAFGDAARDDLHGWDLAIAAAVVRPEGP